MKTPQEDKVERAIPMIADFLIAMDIDLLTGSQAMLFLSAKVAGGAECCTKDVFLDTASAFFDNGTKMAREIEA